MIGGYLSSVETITLVVILCATYGIQDTNGGSLVSDSIYKDNVIGVNDVPSFINSSETSVVTSVGQTAYLHCGVSHLSDRQVSWIRSRDLTILTIGLERYTRDRRFTAVHADGHEFWGLKIVDPQVEDSGMYECQVSYHDDMEKKLKLPFQLTVLESRARILGNRDLYMKEGSLVELECGVENVPAPPAYIYWYKKDEVISYTNRPGIHLSILEQNNSLVSKLTIESARPDDSGNYTCAPANALTDSVLLHVVIGEKPEELKKNANSSSEARSAVFLCLVSLAASAMFL